MFDSVITQSNDRLGRHPGMTIGVALLSRRIAVVASDGRIMSSVPLGPDGTAQAPSVVDSDDEDKTFRAADGRIIGCCAGIMRLEGRRVTELVSNAVGADRRITLDQAADRAGRALRDAFPGSGVDPRRWLANVLLVGRDSNGSSGLCHVRVSVTGVEIAERFSFARGNPPRFFRTIGDQSAMDAAIRILSSERQGTELAFLRRTAIESVRAGINASGPSPDNPDLPACGGAVRVATLFA